ncbi:secreted protein containing APHP domain protein [Candidatus Magnetomorum sp. HK-1]|nr:secreted protein containing APHP domain protein [Candidatus Magnetomorum sp. HK-1]
MRNLTIKFLLFTFMILCVSADSFSAIYTASPMSTNNGSGLLKMEVIINGRFGEFVVKMQDNSTFPQSGLMWLTCLSTEKKVERNKTQIPFNVDFDSCIDDSSAEMDFYASYEVENTQIAWVGPIKVTKVTKDNCPTFSWIEPPNNSDFVRPFFVEGNAYDLDKIKKVTIALIDKSGNHYNIPAYDPTTPEVSKRYLKMKIDPYFYGLENGPITIGIWIVDANNNVGCNNGNEAVSTRNIKWKMRPDLVPYDAPEIGYKKLDSPCFSRQCKDDEEVIINFSCYNDSLVDTNGFEIGIYIDGSLKKSFYLEKLKSYYYQWYENYSIGIINSGQHSIELFCDHKNNVEELYEDENNNKYSTNFYIEASEPNLVSLAINGPSSVGSNRSAQYKATAIYDDDTSKDVTNICTWSLSSTSYASINSSGKLTVNTIKSDKDVIVKANYSENEKTVNDEHPVDLIARIPISIEISGPPSVKSNQSGQYTATVKFDDGTSEDVTNICTWSLSSTSYASINSSGKLTVKTIESDNSVYVKANYSKNGKTVNDEHPVDLIAPIPIQLPPVIKSFNINNNESETFSITVTLFISAINSPTHYKASETQDFNNEEWLPYVEEPEFILSSEYGNKKVYIKLKNEGGESEEISYDDIILKQQEAPELSVTPIEQDISSKGDSFTIKVKNVGTGTLNWDAKIKNNPDWLSINTEFDNGIITVKCLANIGIQRTGEIVISSENATNSPQIVIITQSEYMKKVILTVSDAEAAPGSEGIPVQFSLDNISDNAPASSLQLELKYDSNIVKINGYRTTQRTEGFTVNLKPVENGKNSEVIILLYSMAGLSINPEKGSILEILFDVEQTAQEDESFVLQFNECTVSNKDGDEIQSDFSDTGIFLVTSPCDLCDVNCDGRINILDLQIIIKHIVERTYSKEADLKDDGKINVLDLQICLNCILEQFNSSVKRTRSQVNSEQRYHALHLSTNSANSEPLDSKTMNALSITSSEISENSTGTIGLDLTNQDYVASGQIKIEYDSSTGFEIDDAILTDRTDSFQISFSKQNISSDKAGIMVLFYSMTGSTIEPGFGDILKLNYNSGNNSGKISLAFAEAETILSDKTGNALPVSSQENDILVTDQQLCLDTNQDGQINLIDVIYILQYLNGIIIK